MKVVVIGSRGQLGTESVQAFEEGGHEVVPLSHAEVDVTDQASVREAMAGTGADAVVNCAAYVHVDRAEEEPQTAFAVNAFGARQVARMCADLGAVCIHISTDFVFRGDKPEPYVEADSPRPINIYGASKLAGEHLVQQTCPESLIVRVAGLFGKAGASGRNGNFVEAVLRKARAGEDLQVVDDIRISPTYARDAAWVIRWLAEQESRGIIHVSNIGSVPCTWYALAKKTVDLCGVDASIEEMASENYPHKAKRPPNSALNNALAVQVTGSPIPNWEDALERYLRERGHID